VITSKGDDPWVVFAIYGDGDQRFACDRVITERREGRAVKERFMALFYLFYGIFVVVRGDRDVSYKKSTYSTFICDQRLRTAVNNLEARPEWINCKRHVVSSVKS
jgi:hypothetical protein